MSATNPPSPGSPVVVARYSYRHEAEFASSLLRAAGLRPAIFADDAGGMEVPLSFTNSVRVVVRGDEADEARRILSGENGEGEAADPDDDGSA
jgi:hypothetical protein